MGNYPLARNSFAKFSQIRNSYIQINSIYKKPRLSLSGNLR